MGKKNKTVGLGKSLIRDRFGKQNRQGGDTFLHTSDLKDGYDWGRLNLQSVTDQNNLEDFLSTAELAGTEFTAEKMNIKVIQKDVHGGLPHGEELTKILNLQRQHKDSIRIPRRPHWDRNMSASEVDQNEKAAFLEWRRSLAMLQEVDGLVFTPYEKNLDFWRQLWRVIERSDIIVQIVDARNPLLFYCSDLETYVSEVDPTKQCVLLINKADFLTQSQRDIWAEYCNKRGLRVVFWSAMEETKRQEEEEKQAANADQQSDKEIMDLDEDSDLDDAEEDDIGANDITNTDKTDSASAETGDGNTNRTQCDRELRTAETCDNETGVDNLNEPKSENKSKTDADLATIDNDNKSVDSEVLESVNRCQLDEGLSKHGSDIENTSSEKPEACNDGPSCSTERGSNTGHLYTGHELLEYFRSLNMKGGITTVGMVGYPNVGKSSTINAILNMKKVPVSATPGRTKHFQTLYVDSDLMLCDCPGLVFPSFVTTKADLVISGILPIDQMRDHIPPTSLVCRLIPRRHLEKTYGILISKPREGENPHRAPTAEEFLNAYGAMRGFMNARGMPDCPRSSRYVLKDYVNGKLLYCHPPPGVTPEDFTPYTDEPDSDQTRPGSNTTDVPESSFIDKEFFEKKFSSSHTRTARSGGKDEVPTNDKPWKKHNNKKKKEKLRRVYGYLDQH